MATKKHKTVYRAGISRNPHDKPYMRRVQCILNADKSRQGREEAAVKVLDWMRDELVDEEGKLLTDRQIIREALIAYGQIYKEGFVIPAQEKGNGGISPHLLESILEEMEERLLAVVDRAISNLPTSLPFQQQTDGHPNWKTQAQQEIRQAVQVHAAHHAGKGLRYNPDEDEDDFDEDD